MSLNVDLREIAKKKKKIQFWTRKAKERVWKNLSTTVKRKTFFFLYLVSLFFTKSRQKTGYFLFPWYCFLNLGRINQRLQRRTTFIVIRTYFNKKDLHVFFIRVKLKISCVHNISQLVSILLNYMLKQKAFFHSIKKEG